MDVSRPLAGRRVVTTRDEPGRLDDLLATMGADVLHVGLIEIVDPPDPGRVAAAIGDLGERGWVIVTSRHGARHVGPYVSSRPDLRLAAVGRSTAAVLARAAGRAVDVVPGRQTADGLAAVMPPPDRGVVIAQGDRAEPTLANLLSSAGHDVEVVVAYSTRSRVPTEAERALVRDVDAVTFASGSAAEAWAGAFGSWAPPVVVAIGPTTARVATAVGIAVTEVASEHSVEGLARAVAAAFAARP